MDNDIREILSLVADIMAILGISGIFSWGIFRRGQDPFSETVYGIFSFVWKTAIVFVLFLFLFLITALIASPLSFLVSILYEIVTGSHYDVLSPIPIIIGWIISAGFHIPIFIVSANSIYQSSISPMIKFSKRIYPNLGKQHDDE